HAGGCEETGGPAGFTMARIARELASTREEIALNRSASLDVLRGLTLECRPFFLRRQAADVASPDCVATQSAEQERRRGYEDGQAEGRSEGLREGYEEGVRRGQQEMAVSARTAVEAAVEDATRELMARAERLSSLLDAIEATAAERRQAME